MNNTIKSTNTENTLDMFSGNSSTIVTVPLSNLKNIASSLAYYLVKTIDTDWHSQKSSKPYLANIVTKTHKDISAIGCTQEFNITLNNLGRPDLRIK